MPKYEEKFPSHKAGSMSMIGKAKSEALKKKKDSKGEVFSPHVGKTFTDAMGSEHSVTKYSHMKKADRPKGY